MPDDSTWEGLKLSNDRFEVSEPLGFGGMGLVYLARDTHLKCNVVIKTPRPDMFTGSAIARFKREICSLVHLVHPHIVHILDVGEHDGLPFVVLQYLSGGSLREQQKVAASGKTEPMPLETLCDWLEDIADALDFIHEQGFVHRDVKPDNILFDPHGHPYLTDFGVAKLLASDEHGNAVTNVTSTGAMVGTPYYMAPELVQGQPVDGRTDQYALAVTVHELLAGTVPLDGEFRAAIMMAHTSKEPPLLSDIVCTIPRGVALAVKQSLAKKPEDRFPDCRSFAAAVLESLAESGAGRVRVPVSGWWYARAENDPSAEWWEVGQTPAMVTLSPGEVYWLLARDTVTDQQVASLARLTPLPRLRSLGLSLLQRLTDTGLAHLRGLTDLEALNLSGCKQLTDAALAHLRGLTRLQSLSLDETQISDAGLEALRSFPHLQALTLGQCRRISDRGLSHLAGHQSLQKLLLANCPGITDAGMVHLEGLTELRTLDIACTSVTDIGLGHLRSLIRLEHLNLAGLEGVTDAGLLQLRGLTSLQGLDVRRCRGVTAAGVEALRGHLSGCRVSGP